MLVEDECLCGAVFSVAGSFADCATLHGRWLTAHRVCRNQAAHDAASAASEDQHSEPGRIPERWELVPVEPTREMRMAFHNAQDEVDDSCQYVSPDHQWGAMLAAAPAPDADEREDG